MKTHKGIPACVLLAAATLFVGCTSAGDASGGKGMDVGVVSDGGGEADAGSSYDAGAGGDSWIETDAGFPVDTGGGADGGATGDVNGDLDATQILDTGSLDSGMVDDTGMPEDAGAASDGGTTGDAGAADAGTPRQCPQGAHCFEAAGLVHKPTPGNEFYRQTFQAPAGTFHQMHVELTVYHGGWATDPEAVRHSVIWVAKSARNFDQFEYVFFTRPNAVTLRHGLGLDAGSKVKVTKTVQIPEFQTYLFVYDYDTQAGTALLEVFREGTPLSTLDAPPNVTEFSFDAKDTIDVDFSFTGVDNPAEPATYNWEYRNLWLWVM